MKWFFFLIFLSSCSLTKESESEFDLLLSQGQCEQAALNIPQFKLQRTTANINYILGSSASYVLTSAAYGVDVVYFITGGVALPLILCSPVIMLENPGAPYGVVSSSELTEKCLIGVHNSTQKYDKLGNRKNLGSKVYRNTSQLRCPNFEFAVRDILKLVNCYEEVNQKQKAINQLENLIDPRSFGGCISKNSIIEIESRIEQLTSVKNQ